MGHPVAPHFPVVHKLAGDAELAGHGRGRDALLETMLAKDCSGLRFVAAASSASALRAGLGREVIHRGLRIAEPRCPERLKWSGRCGFGHGFWDLMKHLRRSAGVLAD